MTLKSICANDIMNQSINVMKELHDDILDIKANDNSRQRLYDRYNMLKEKYKDANLFEDSNHHGTNKVKIEDCDKLFDAVDLLENSKLSQFTLKDEEISFPLANSNQLTNFHFGSSILKNPITENDNLYLNNHDNHDNHDNQESENFFKKNTFETSEDTEKINVEEEVVCSKRKKDINKNNMNSILRIRPSPKNEESGNFVLVNDKTLEATLEGGRKTFTFDKIYGSKTTQSEFFDGNIKDLLLRFYEGNKSELIFTYGMTGSGKTHTVVGNEGDPGILPRTIEYMLKRKNSNESLIKELFENSKTKILCQYYEIYNEECYDLLKDYSDIVRKSLKLRPEITKSPSNMNKRNNKIDIKSIISGRLGVSILLKSNKLKENITEIEILNYSHFQKILAYGICNKSHACTSLNDNSSRSHTIFNIILEIESVFPNKSFTIVDLAGSERAKRTETTGINFIEATKINSSLSVLGKCLDTMKNNTLISKNGGLRKMSPIPFRESKLTMLFQEYFLGEHIITMITNINPRKSDYEETVRALNFSCVWKEIIPKKSICYTNIITNNLNKSDDKKQNVKENSTNMNLNMDANPQIQEKSIAEENNKIENEVYLIKENMQASVKKCTTVISTENNNIDINCNIDLERKSKDETSISDSNDLNSNSNYDFDEENQSESESENEKANTNEKKNVKTHNYYQGGIKDLNKLELCRVIGHIKKDIEAEKYKNRFFNIDDYNKVKDKTVIQYYEDMIKHKEAVKLFKGHDDKNALKMTQKQRIKYIIQLKREIDNLQHILINDRINFEHGINPKFEDIIEKKELRNSFNRKDNDLKLNLNVNVSNNTNDINNKLKQCDKNHSNFNAANPNYQSFFDNTHTHNHNHNHNNNENNNDFLGQLMKQFGKNFPLLVLNPKIDNLHFYGYKQNDSVGLNGNGNGNSVDNSNNFQNTETANKN